MRTRHRMRTSGPALHGWWVAINTKRAVPPGRHAEEVAGSVARKDAKDVLERFLAFPEQ